MVAKALNILAAAGIIALVFISFTLASSLTITKQKFDIGSSTADISRAGQTRLFVRAIVDNIARGDCSGVARAADDAYGHGAKVSVLVDGRLLCGEDIAAAGIETVLPRPDGSVMRVEVRRS
jgi:hypothetical protein